MGSVAAETGEAQLYERHSDLVYRYCLRMLGTREDAEDAAQTTFFQALRALRRGVVPSYEQAWLLTIARNECKSRYRAGSRRRRLELAHDPQSLAELAEAPNGGDGRLVGIEQALARLPEMQRRALLLREWQGRSYAEIARELGASQAAVEALIFRARRGVARQLGEETKRRRHALDVASLLGALKSLLGGGSAVKAAVAIAAVASVGTVAAGSAMRPSPAPSIRAPGAAVVERPTSAPVRSRPVTADTPSRPNRNVVKGAPTAKPGSAPRSTKPAPSAKAPVAPAAVRVEQSTPQPSPAHTPIASPAQTPSLPAVPSVPAPEPPPSLPLPTGQLPIPQVPQLPEVPQLPQLPQVPDLPQLPDVPDLPVVPDVPILP